MEENKFLENVAEEYKENIYETTVVIGKRARQIVEHRREAFRRDLDNMGILEFNTGQLINTDGWQAILAKSYEDKESPVVCACKELKEGKLVHSYVETTSSFLHE